MVKLKTAWELRQREEKLQKKLDKLNASYIELKDTIRAQEAKQGEVLQEWKGWLISSGLSPELSPEHVLEILSAIRACLEKQKNIKELENR